MAYVIICKEPEVDAYVLPDGATTMEGAKQLMAFRAEEYLDEAAEEDAEAGIPVGDRAIDFECEGTVCTVRPIVDGTQLAPVMTMTIQQVEING